MPCLPDGLRSLATLLDESPSVLGDAPTAAAALSAAQFLFNLGVRSEDKSLPHISGLLSSFHPTHAPKTRSQTRRRASQHREQPSTLVLAQRTPIASLFVQGLEDDQVWSQLELRTNNVWKAVHLALQGTSSALDIPEDDENQQTGELIDRDINSNVDDDEREAMDEEDEDEDEPGTGEEEEDEDEDADNEIESEVNGDEFDETIAQLRDSTDDDEHAPSDLKDRQNIRQRYRSRHSVLDDDFFDLAAFNSEIEEAEARSVSKGSLSRSVDGSDDGNDDEEAIDFYSTVDFSDMSHAMAQSQDTSNISYADFFAPPIRAHADALSPRKTKVRFHDEVRIKNIKPRGKNLPLSLMNVLLSEGEGDDEDEIGDEGEGVGDVDLEGEHLASQGGNEDSYDEKIDGSYENGDWAHDGDSAASSFSEEHSTRDARTQLDDDLFAEEKEEMSGDLSTHEKRLAALREQIVALEEENVTKRGWTLMGEASSKARPENSLLEEDLEFERAMKATPIVTVDSVQGLEEKIKSRILSADYDDVVRRRLADDRPFLPSRFFELQDTKSDKSLAQIYENEFVAAQANSLSNDRDGKLVKEQGELEAIWESLSHKLDALSNAHFTPKAPKATITAVSNVASASIESALPMAKSVATMLAPEEVYSSSSKIRARGELTPQEKRVARNKRKKARKKLQDVAGIPGRRVSKGSLGKGGSSGYVESRSVVKPGRGVSVVGKSRRRLS